MCLENLVSNLPTDTEWLYMAIFHQDMNVYYMFFMTALVFVKVINPVMLLPTGF